MKELLNLYLKFFKIGAVTFGGGYAMLPILRREIVEKEKWISEEEIIDFYAIGQSMPGIIAVNVGGFIGYRRRKEAGAVAAALGVVSPCLVIITIIAAALSGFQDNVYVRHALSAVSVCVCALILDSIIAMWKKGVKDLFGFVLFAVMLLAMTFTKASPVLLVIASAVLGIAVKTIDNIKSDDKKGGKDK
ncbi:MAG: chromate transporter [Oscillospiraceae bacterium]|nr:chromate transporter [Oscillospiraceae bacterium]MBQ7815800.1 chromate transporter [Oscillospiraceae bacterium]